jgi:hypothetical protein
LRRSFYFVRVAAKLALPDVFWQSKLCSYNGKGNNSDFPGFAAAKLASPVVFSDRASSAAATTQMPWLPITAVGDDRLTTYNL